MMFFRRQLLMLALWPIVAVSSVSAGGESLSVEVADHPKFRVLAIGDSFTDGFISGEPAPAYVEILRTVLGRDFEVVKLGCGGSTVLDFTRPPFAVKICNFNGAYELLVAPETPADLATILFGTNEANGFMENDCRKDPKIFEQCPVSAERFKASMIALIDRLVSQGVPQVILLKPSKRPKAAAFVSENLRAYGVAVGEICAARSDVTCGPDLYQLLDLERDFVGDNIHPNANGHRLIGEALARVVREVLRD